MALVTELDLPAFDYTDAELRGQRFHEAMRELRAQGWLAAAPLGYFVLDREAGGFFLRTRSADVPGHEDRARCSGSTTGRCYEEIARNILHINGADHRAAAQPREPGVHAARGRALAPGDARVPRRSSWRRRRQRRAASSWRPSRSRTRRW